MRTAIISLALAMTLASTSALAQSAAAPAARPPGKLTQEQIANTNALRSLVKATPSLPVDRVVLKVSPEIPIVGVTAMAADAKGNIYVLHRPKEGVSKADGDAVIVLDPTGKVLRTWGKGLYGIPHGIKVDPLGNVWTIDANTSVVRKFTPEGKQLLEISVGDIPDPKRAFCGASDVGFGPGERVFVSDGYCNGRVIEYSPEGKKLREWGSRGTGPGQFINAHGIAVAPDGTVYVADRENGRVQWFTPEGKLLGERKLGGQLFSVAVSAKGDVYVGTQPRDVPFGTDAHIFKLDPANGKLIGTIQIAAHQLSVAPDGSLLPGPRTSEVVIFRPRN